MKHLLALLLFSWSGKIFAQDPGIGAVFNLKDGNMPVVGMHDFGFMSMYNPDYRMTMRECDSLTSFDTNSTYSCRTIPIYYYKPFKGYSFSRLGEYSKKNSYEIKIVRVTAKDSMIIDYQVNLKKYSWGDVFFDTIQYKPGIYELGPITDDDLSKTIRIKDKLKGSK